MLARSATRVIVSEQASFVEYRLLTPSLRHRLLRLAMRFLYRRAHAVTAVSTALALEVAEGLGLPENRVLYAPNPIVSQTLIEQAEAGSPHPWFADELPVIVAAGRLVPEKDHALLLRAFAGMARPVRLIIVGEGRERPALERQARELGIAGRVALPGFDPNPFAFMRRAGLFVLSSRTEGLPSVLIEAMACGAPVVSTDCRTGPREILEGGRWGRLVPVGDAAALARAMDDALACDDHPDVRRRAADYSVAASVERYLGLIRSASRPRSR